MQEKINTSENKHLIDAYELIERVHKWTTVEDVEAPPEENWYTALMCEIYDMLKHAE